MPHTRKGVKTGNDSVLRAFRESQVKVASIGEPPPLTVQEWAVDRDGGLPLSFEGTKLSSAETSMEVKYKGDPQLQGTTVTLYVTTGGNLVTEVLQWRRTSYEQDDEEVYRKRAAHHASPEAALEWLYQDGGGKLGRTSKQAWLLACQRSEALEGYNVERVD